MALISQSLSIPYYALFPTFSNAKKESYLITKDDVVVRIRQTPYFPGQSSDSRYQVDTTRIGMYFARAQVSIPQPTHSPEIPELDLVFYGANTLLIERLRKFAERENQNGEEPRFHNIKEFFRHIVRHIAKDRSSDDTKGLQELLESTSERVTVH